MEDAETRDDGESPETAQTLTRAGAGAPPAGQACRDFCLQVLQLLGCRVEPLRHPAGESFRIELSDRLAWRWGSRGRPQPALWLAFDNGPHRDALRLPASQRVPPDPTASVAAGCSAERPEVVLPDSRRFWEIGQLILELGWLAVFHQPGRRHFPALWLWTEAVADGGPLGQAPVARPAAVWAPLAGDDREVAVHLFTHRVALPARTLPARPAPRKTAAPKVTGTTQQRLPVIWGPPPPRRPLRPPLRPRRSLAAALEKAAAALASFLLAGREFRQWVSRLAESFPDARPRIRLFLTLAALTYLDTDAPWPPPPLLDPIGPSP